MMTQDDAHDEMIILTAATEMGRWLNEAGILKKAVHQLTITELEMLAAVAISSAIVTRSRLQSESVASEGSSITV